ncbi:iron-sulfur cluster biosynthesis family protein, partial [Citrobacter freundii]|uniref:iron-sulfur cluster biosynthesis family protein n=1 Tax=Citrobacter freundii TaxID=546 RepID=UPI0013E30AAF
MELHSGTFNPDDFAWRGLTLTPAAAAHIRELVAKQPDMLGVRLGVKQTGCAGFGYVLDTVREAQKDDLLFETDGARLYVPLLHNPKAQVLTSSVASVLRDIVPPIPQNFRHSRIRSGLSGYE